MFGRAESVQIGRYVLGDELGRGGMGVVYGAHDPKLDRVVAIKVLQAAGLPASRRLEREARALAQLQHPNVVEVFDVGRADGRVYIVMHRVLGQTLAAWLEGRPGRAEVMSAFVSAASGLSAAHAAGLVHRDFKPSNVLVGEDGSIRVSDFGLAHLGGPDSEREEAEESLSGSQTLSAARAGTPIYMAPEQHDGAPLGAATDQFAFCAALLEALTGRRPFAGETSQELRRAKGQPPPALEGLEPRVAAVLRRGLAEDAAKRWASIDELVAELESPAASRRTASIWVAGVSGFALIGAAAYGIVAAHEDRQCALAGERVLAIWDEAHRRSVDDAVAAFGPSYAADAWIRLQPRVDAYTESLASAALRTCMIARDGEDVAAKQACIEARVRRLEASLEMLAGEPALFGTKFAVDGWFTHVAPCSGSSRAQPSLPATAVAALARIDGLRSLRKLEEAEALARAAISDAADEPTRVRASLELGRILLAAHQDSQAEAVLAQAFVDADRLGDSDTAVRAAAALAAHAAQTLDLSAAEPWTRELRSRLQQPDLSSPATRASAEAALAAYHVAIGDTVEAERHGLAAVAALAEGLGEEHPQTLLAQANAVEPLLRRGRSEEAAARLNPLVPKLEQALGPRHPKLAVLHQLRANLERTQGRSDDALASITTAIDILREASDGPSRDLAIAWAWRASILKRQGKLDEASADYRRARDVFELIGGSESLHAAAMNGDLSSLALQSGNVDEAIGLAQRAFDAVREAVGREHELTLVACGRLLDALLEAERPAELARIVEECGPLSTTLDTDPGLLVNARVALGRAASALEDPTAARAHLEAAHRLATEKKLSAEHRAHAAFHLAIVLHADEPERAVALVEDSIDGLRAGTQRDELKLWLDAR